MAAYVHFLCVMSAVSVGSACRDLQEVFTEVRNYYQDVAMPRRFDDYAAEAAQVNIDVYDDTQIRDLACRLAYGVDYAMAMLHLSRQQKQDLRFIIDERFLYTYPMELTIWPSVQREYKAAFEFLNKTDFPNFPLNLTVESAFEHVRQAGDLGLGRVFGDVIPYSDDLKHQLATALAEARTVQEFDTMTFRKYTGTTQNFAARLEDMNARYTDAKARPGIQTKVLRTLSRYGLYHGEIPASTATLQHDKTGQYYVVLLSMFIVIL